MAIGKLCLFCKEFRIQAGSPGYSELTPGWDFEMECRKEHWTFDKFNMNEDEYRDLLRKAESCKDYLHHKKPKKKIPKRK